MDETMTNGRAEQDGDGHDHAEGVVCFHAALQS
jgi:hypothetical protein